ncbi:MAG: hypothetical protein QNJ16_11200 [Rhodobacter sp.]|nr:hypothetical protein [Rhodobacter sp.]
MWPRMAEEQAEHLDGLSIAAAAMIAVLLATVAILPQTTGQDRQIGRDAAPYLAAAQGDN